MVRQVIIHDAAHTYDEALVWMFANIKPAHMQAVIESGAPLPSAARFICDLFWITEKRLRDDLMRLWYPERFGPRMTDGAACSAH